MRLHEGRGSARRRSVVSRPGKGRASTADLVRPLGSEFSPVQPAPIEPSATKLEGEIALKRATILDAARKIDITEIAMSYDGASD